ncbi:MAG TPA: bifunctional YncE family protein/alkaline phosphatase family protein [Caulobacteraceae bacterium]|nr:bifunctional YncE family protein/alkaline phosphatase family protein [Caulobacteraceae bacterium]
MGRLAAIAAALAAAWPGLAMAARAQFTPTGQFITPDAAPGSIFQPLNPHLAADPSYEAGQASAVALSPDGRTLLILTSGFNIYYTPEGARVPDMSEEYVFVLDVSGPKPVQRQAILVPNTFLGLGWAPDGAKFYVSGGRDDVVYEYAPGASGYEKARTFKLGHSVGVGLAVPVAAGPLAVSPDDARLIVANVQNDSVSVIDLASGAIHEQDLRPGVIDPAKAGTPGGSFPRAVVWTSATHAFVASERDREVIGLEIGADTVRVTTRAKVEGQPVALAARGGRVYAALDNDDKVATIDAASGRVTQTFHAALGPGAPPALAKLGGAGTNGLAISGDGRTLYATNGGANDVAVISLAAKTPHVVGLIPTGWYPTAVAAQPSGRQLYVVNGKSNAGPNPGNCRVNTGIDPHHDDICRGRNSYVWQIEKAGFLTLRPPAPAALAKLTTRVVANNRYAARSHAGEGEATMAFLRAHIHHVIYIVKENRTYDQVLGDLEVGDGDPKLVVFGRAMTPNQHMLARQFVDLDAFFDSGESSNTGWDWTTAARTNDWTEREAPVNYADRGLQYDQEGANRNINMGYATSAERQVANPLSPADPNVLPGARDVAAPDGPGGEEGRGYLWDAALRAGLSIRNYGFFGDLTRYEPITGQYMIPLEREPAKTGHQVIYVDKAALMGVTDPYYWGFNQALADFWREREWEREFDGYVAKGAVPNLMMVRLAHDHTGAFAQGLDGVNSVETELADNDYAVGLLIEKVAHSPIANDTLIFIVEDDAQDGPDHVDAHRSIAFVVGPYVKHGAVVSSRYTTVNMLRTIEGVLGLSPMGLNDALAAPMADAFDPRQAAWTFTAQVPSVLRTTQLPLPSPTSSEAACPARPPRSAAYWTAAMAGQDFTEEDRLDVARYNRALWRGLKGDVPYPAGRDGHDLRQRRAALLAAAGVAGCS